MSEPAPAVPPASDEPPFIPHGPEEEPLPGPHPGLLRNRPFLRLWGAQIVSSLGDWIGLVAILALAARVSNTGAAIALVMTARMLPGFVLAPIGGAIVDRWDRKRVMVACDVGRAALLVLLPFWDTLVGLVVMSFLIEVLTLLWAPAKDASVPNVVRDPDQLASANSLGLVAAYGTFPLGAVCFALLAGLAKWLADAFSGFDVDQESLAIWFDSLTFVGSALLISRLSLPEERRRVERVQITRTFRDIVDGLRFIRTHPLVRGVMIGLAGGLLGGGAIVPLGPVFNKQVLGGDSEAFGWLMTALGVGAALGVVTLLWIQRRVPREQVFTAAVVGTGAAIVLTASVSTLAAAIVLVTVVGAAAGTSYVTGFTVLQESVHDDLRGRTFATLYTVVRLCLLLSLTLGPATAGLFDAIGERTLSDDWQDTLPGVRLALWLGGGATVVSGLVARRSMRHGHDEVDVDVGTEERT